MKKTFLGIASSLLLFSCSTNSFDPVFPEEELRIVNFQVSTFEQNLKPMQRANPTPGSQQSTTFHYVVFSKATGNFVKQKNFVSNYDANPSMVLKDTLEAGQYTVCIAMQYVQDGAIIAQPNLTKNYNEATFNYTPASAVFFETYDIDVTQEGYTADAKLSRVTGATEIYITDVKKLGDIDITIGAYNIPQAFKVSTLESIKTDPTNFSITFPIEYYTFANHYYKDNYPGKEILPFPAIYTGAFKGPMGTGIAGTYPETFYRYIHSMPTTDLYYEIAAGSETKKIENVKIESNKITTLTGEFAALRDNGFNITIDDSWETGIDQPF